MNSPLICTACGVQSASVEPERCPICEDSRAFGRERGHRQQWTMPTQLRSSHSNRIRRLDEGIVSIATEPKFSVGHHCLLIEGRAGNMLWDCISLVDDATVKAVVAAGGISAMAISHPHFYGSMIEWSRAFGNVPIYLHMADRAWVRRDDPALVFWEGDTLRLNDEFTLVRCGGHFDGGTVLHQAREAHAGRIFTGDIIDVLEDGAGVTFMHNYPKQIPLPASAIDHIVEVIEPFEFERVYGCWPEKVITAGGKAAVLRSADSYIQHVAI
jgi:hypothetical protein